MSAYTAERVPRIRDGCAETGFAELQIESATGSNAFSPHGRTQSEGPDGPILKLGPSSTGRRKRRTASSRRWKIRTGALPLRCSGILKTGPRHATPTSSMRSPRQSADRRGGVQSPPTAPRMRCAQEGSYAERRGGWRDLSEMSPSDERAEGAHLP